ncbi:hypothetical protein CIPAW_03G086900 [Carya illinoinensis]|uniref:Uncharacterized protein n=1 Tax=Carya illinoinensis TaxID=32201 RepID=A0A8T1R1G1_CARIL|nr:hypothetical protein CIPAW_03G086900 [Carya illinoinensis]
MHPGIFSFSFSSVAIIRPRTTLLGTDATSNWIAGMSTRNGWLASLQGVHGRMNITCTLLQHPAYVWVHQQLQIQLLQLEQTFLPAAIALETGVALNKDSSATTISVEAYYQHHTQHYCQSMFPTSLRVLHVHLISSNINSLVCIQYSGLLSN